MKLPRTLFSEQLPAALHADFVTIRLQPQMKKYRCLWYMSTRNHNILYSADILGIRLLNIGNCLWKAQNSLARRGLQVPTLPQILCTLRSGPRNWHVSKPSPRRCREQGAEPVQFDGACANCGDWGRFQRESRFAGKRTAADRLDLCPQPTLLRCTGNQCRCLGP